MICKVLRKSQNILKCVNFQTLPENAKLSCWKSFWETVIYHNKTSCVAEDSVKLEREAIAVMVSIEMEIVFSIFWPNSLG